MFPYPGLSGSVVFGVFEDAVSFISCLHVNITTSVFDYYPLKN